MHNSTLPPLVIAAAGKSSRFGSPKGLMLIDGEPLIIRLMRLYEEGGGQHCWLMFSEDKDAYDQALKSFSTTLNIVSKKITHDEPHLTPTLIEALQDIHLTMASTPFYFCPVDVPLRKGDVFAHLLSSMEDMDAVIPSFDGRGGHPVLLSARVNAQLLTCDKQSARLDVMIKSLPLRKYVAIDDHAYLQNLNTVELYDAYLKSDLPG
jgi:molybdenum cofactor cytidylyltransferase